jgi:hypothetical protein
VALLVMPSPVTTNSMLAGSGGGIGMDGVMQPAIAVATAIPATMNRRRRMTRRFEEQATVHALLHEIRQIPQRCANFVGKVQTR